MCIELEKLSDRFMYDSDDADGGLYLGNEYYDRYKGIVDHIANCASCQSEGWKSAVRHDGHIWYGKDNAIYTWIMEDNRDDRGFQSISSEAIEVKSGRSPNDQRSDAHNPTSREYRSNMNDHANQSNPGSAAHKAAMNNRANQVNPNHRASKGKR